MSKAFLDALLAASGGEQHVHAWENVLRTAFADLRNLQFKEPWRIDGKLSVLDVLLQPQTLQQALVRHLPPAARLMAFSHMYISESNDNGFKPHSCVTASFCLLLLPSSVDSFAAQD